MSTTGDFPVGEEGEIRSRASVRIVADDRERAGGVIGELRRLEGVRLEVRRLAVGDFLVEDRFLVERKTLADFAQSVVDARLFKQVRCWRQTDAVGFCFWKAALRICPEFG